MTNEIQKQYDSLEDVPSIILRMKDVYAVPNRHIRYAATKAFFGKKMAEGSSVQSHGVTMLSLVEKLEDLKVVLNKTREASTSKAKGKGARRWKRKKGKGTAVTATASTGGAPPTAPKGKGKGKVGGSQQSKVLQRSKKLSKDEMILRLGEGKAVAVEAVGSLSLVVSNHVRIELKDCYYVPSMVKNIISISMLDRDGYKFLINKNCFHLVHEDVYHILGTLVNGFYILQQSNLIMTAQHKRKVDDHENAQIWHARLGHISKDRIRRLVDTKSLEIDDLDHLPTCESSLKEKMTKKPFVGQSAIAKGLLDLVHTDVCGPLSIPARGGFSYFHNLYR
ncbi:UNVERIFIED_CONTAM: hypothetical protein Sradi_3182700 [Sesamum radiatum]|uniref:GAG-pre-integrase domain-containing protein n=1 Tax=Sesamum radiatum TaxID=300843 RepID=A0AAW2REZ0_SESRA